VRVKICGLTCSEDARSAESLGADFLGFVLSEGFGRSVPEARVAGVAEGTSAARVAVLVDEPAGRAAALAGSLGASVVQLHGSESPETAGIVRASGPWHVWKAVRARSIEDVARYVLDYGSVVDGLVVEGWKEGVVGGGGARLELRPDDVRTVVPRHLTFVLAGGLTPDGVGDAVVRFSPDVVDVSSGVELALGRKDPEKVRAFIEAARGAERGP
jgi:phosphoribosylanthranilate isomerase